MRVFIIGAGGFIGLNLVKLLSANKYTVYAGIRENIDRPLKKSRQQAKLTAFVPGPQIVVGNVTDGFVSAEWLEKNKIDVVIYSAGQSEGPIAVEDFKKCTDPQKTNTMQVNAFGPHLLAGRCQAAAKKTGKVMAFIYISSIYADNAAKIEVDINKAPSHSAEMHYSCSKLFGEQLIAEYKELHIEMIRLPRMIGIYQYTKATTALLRDKVIMGEKPEVGDNEFAVTPVTCMNKIILGILSADFKKGEYNKRSFPAKDTIYTTPKKLAQEFDRAIVAKLKKFSVFKEEKAKDSEALQKTSVLGELTEEIVMERANDAAMTIQFAWKKQVARKGLTMKR